MPGAAWLADTHTVFRCRLRVQLPMASGTTDKAARPAGTSAALAVAVDRLTADIRASTAAFLVKARAGGGEPAKDDKAKGGAKKKAPGGARRDKAGSAATSDDVAVQSILVRPEAPGTRGEVAAGGRIPGMERTNGLAQSGGTSSTGLCCGEAVAETGHAWDGAAARVAEVSLLSCRSLAICDEGAGGGSKSGVDGALPAPHAAPGVTFLPQNGTVPHEDSTRNYGRGSSGTSVQLVPVELDVLAFAEQGAPLEQGMAAVAEALCSQLAVITAELTKQPRAANGAAWQVVRGVHFLPPGYPHPVTCVYPLGADGSEAHLGARRMRLHKLLGLPLDRPLLRLANAVIAVGAGLGDDIINEGPCKRLRNVHEGLPKSFVKGGTEYLVDGAYEYYHYMQDRIDDNGWGCAYRSLQTICSWFRLHHYVAAPAPSHRLIQETLVKIGDKEPSFIGSSQWIGAIELSYVLDELFGVTCKILSVQSGSEMPGKARELARHFETEGTPIMIGGGVLAYTLLGVDFNEKTGECAFLILDPHYTGGEDIKSIHSGGWCGWKRAQEEGDGGGKSLFLRHAFYNLLMPQRPRTV
eukprot:jgi/Mesvir1/6470/Mv19545-RA.1